MSGMWVPSGLRLGRRAVSGPPDWFQQKEKIAYGRAIRKFMEDLQAAEKVAEARKKRKME